MREIEIAIELGSGPNLSSFDSPMFKVHADEIGLFALLKIKGEIFEQRGLIAFDGEVVMGLSIFDQIVGELALGQQRIGAYGFAFNVDSLKQWNRHLDLVGLLDFVTIAYRQSADFFWVWQTLVS